MNNLTLWKISDEAIKFKKELKDELDSRKEEIVNGSLLHSQQLVIEYSNTVGFIEGLQFVLDKFKVEEEHKDEIA